jgi:hypothetical protein
MIEEYENWEDSIRRTFIELANYMEKHANPLESIIDFAWASGADMFWVNNAKDELKKLRSELYCVAWARMNQQGDLFDIRQQQNPYIENLIPLFIKDKDVQQALSSINTKPKQ